MSYSSGLRHFTVHSYPINKASCGLSCFMKTRRSRKDYRFLASSLEEAVHWVSGFADQQCFVNCSPHPLVSSKKQASDLVALDSHPESHIKCKSPPRMLVILNPRSGRGRSSKVFEGMVEPIFKVHFISGFFRHLSEIANYSFYIFFQSVLVGANHNCHMSPCSGLL